MVSFLLKSYSINKEVCVEEWDSNESNSLKKDAYSFIIIKLIFSIYF